MNIPERQVGSSHHKPKPDQLVVIYRNNRAELVYHTFNGLVAPIDSTGRLERPFSWNGDYKKYLGVWNGVFFDRLKVYTHGTERFVK